MQHTNTVALSIIRRAKTTPVHEPERYLRCKAVWHCDDIPGERRKSKITAWESIIVEIDDPLWIATEREIHRLSECETEAAVAMLGCDDMTPIGAIALLQHSGARGTSQFVAVAKSLGLRRVEAP